MLFLGRMTESAAIREKNCGRAVLDVVGEMIASEEFREGVFGSLCENGALPHDRLSAGKLREVADFAAETGLTLRASPEFPTGSEDISALEPLDGEAFLRAAYQTFLAREPDHEGEQYYRAQIEEGNATKREILAEIRASAEFRQRAAVPPLGWRHMLAQVFACEPMGRLLEQHHGPASRAFVAALRPGCPDLDLHVEAPGWHGGPEAVPIRNRLWIAGRASARDGVASVEIAAGERHLAWASLGLPCPDAAGRGPDRPNADRGGFAAVIPARDLPDEARVVRVVLRDKAGRTATAELFVERAVEGPDGPSRPVPGASEIAFHERLLDACAWRPCFVLVMPIAAADESTIAAARASLAALRAQPYADWRLLAVAPAYSGPRALRESLAEGAPALAGHIAVAAAGGEASLARIARRLGRGRPPLCLPLAPGEELGADALFALAATSAIDPAADLITGAESEDGPGLSSVTMSLLDRMDARPDALLARGAAGFAAHCRETASAARHLPFRLVHSDARSCAQPVAPPDRQRLVDFLGEEFGESAVRRVLDYFEIVAALGTRHPPGAASRREILAALVARMRRLAQAANDGRPVEASVVIPVFNQLEYTIASVISLLEHKCSSRYELLIGNDASTDETRETFEAVGGVVRCITHESNRGFLDNCNLSAKHARGKYIILLNNDTFVLDNWLDELIGTFAHDEKIGLTGSKLINSDGSLQEAGGIFWKDGSAWNFGRDQEAIRPEFNYVKEVDYCSGAAIALPKTLWEAMGGFDPLYAPAYCEDADLAFRLRAAGWKVVYQPFAAVIHHEGRSHGRDTAAGVKAYQVVNQKKLLDRWSYVLAKEHFPNGETVFLARDRTRRRPHILVVDHYVPQWDRDAGSRSIYHYLRLLREDFQITFWSDNLYRDPIYTKPLQQLGVEVIYSHHYVGRFAEWMEANGRYFNYVLLSRPHITINYVEAVKRHAGGPIFYYGHDLHWLRLEKELALTGDPAVRAEMEEMRALEERVWNEADVVLYLIAEECEVVRRRFPGKKTAAVPGFIHDRAALAEARRRLADDPRRDPFHLLFVGGFAHRPNGDGILWFVREVFDRLRARDRRYRLTIVGSNPTQEITALVCADLAITGHISDAALEDLYRTAGAAIVPLRYGGGIKGKVIESFANVIPLVTTGIGLQGIGGGAELAFVADDPQAFADRVCEASTDRVLAMAKARRAIAFLEANYSCEAARRLLSEYIEEFQEIRQ